MPDQLSISLPSTRAVRAGWVISAIPVALFAMGIVTGLSAPPEVVAGTEAMGYGAHHLRPFALTQLAIVVLYLVPRTAPLGAVLLTAWLGGAVATHVRIGDPFVAKVLLPVYVAIPVWAGLWLRDARVRALTGARR